MLWNCADWEDRFYNCDYQTAGKGLDAIRIENVEKNSSQDESNTYMITYILERDGYEKKGKFQVFHGDREMYLPALFEVAFDDLKEICEDFEQEVSEYQEKEYGEAMDDRARADWDYESSRI